MISQYPICIKGYYTGYKESNILNKKKATENIYVYIHRKFTYNTEVF